MIMKSFLALFFLAIEQYISMGQPAGTILVWGHNSTNVVAIDGEILTNATAIAVGEGQYLALKSNGTVAGWGWNDFGQATGVRSGPSNGLVTIDGQVLSNVTAIDAGMTQSIALKNDGTVAIWGADDTGHKFEVPLDLTNAIAVTAGWDHCLVLNKDGTVISLVGGSARMLDVSNVVAITGQVHVYGAGFGGFGDELALKSDGTVVGWHRGILEHSSSFPRELTNITAIASDASHYLALTKEGTVFGWGINENGRATGVPTTNHVASGFVSIHGRILTNVVAIAAGRDCSLALRRNGTVVAWGGLGFRQPAFVPAGLSNVVAIAAGADHCLAITTNAAVAERFMPKGK
jgi:alpha-tubulin suppressor-like RCC1 family protein